MTTGGASFPVEEAHRLLGCKPPFWTAGRTAVSVCQARISAGLRLMKGAYQLAGRRKGSVERSCIRQGV
jgi:hypothetical protein